MRKAVVAGKFYSHEPQKLLGEIKALYTHKFGPGIPGNKKKDVLGIISPHAGLAYSGACAAHGYKCIAESKKIDTFIILGFNHSGLGTTPVGTTLSNWETPLGVCKIDMDMVMALKENAGVEVEEFSHIYEHSIEMQLPMLQQLHEFSFVPICVSAQCDHKKVGAGIAKSAKQQKKRVCIIASSDFTHFGPMYRYVPFKEDIRANVEKLDMGAIALIEKLDSARFLEYVRQTRATICGKDPIALQIEAMKAMGAKKAQLLKYYTSGDLTGDHSNSVSYASLAFY